MTTPTFHTPLECLFLFQSLSVYGTDDQTFVEISDRITNNAIVKGADTYDPSRLTSDALQQLFLQLLREELKYEQNGQQDGSQPGSKKRKIQSPPLPTLKDAQEHEGKLGILVDKLYARYKDHIERGIREDEEQYAELDLEIAELERLQAEDLLNGSTVLAKQNGNIIAEESLPRTNGTTPVLQPKEKEVEAENVAPSVDEVIPSKVLSPPLPPPHIDSRPQEVVGNDAITSTASPVPSSPKVDQRSSNGVHNVPPQQPPYQQPPVGARGPSPLQPPQQSPLQPPQQPQQSPQLQQPGMAYKWEKPYQVGPPHPQYPYPPQYPIQGFPPPPRGSFSSPQGVPPHLQVPSSPQNSQSPMLLPPGHHPQGSPGMQPMDALADAAGQQYRAPSGSPLPQQGPFTPGGYPPPYPPQQRPPSGPVPPAGPQWNQQYPPPFPGTPQQYYTPPPNQRPPFPPRPDLAAEQNRHYNSPYNGSQGPRPVPSMPGAPQQMFPGTPVNQGKPIRITGSGTIWTWDPLTASSPRQPIPYQHSPAFEPISPQLKPAKLPSAKKPGKKAAAAAAVAVGSTPEIKIKKKPGPKPGVKRGSYKVRGSSGTPAALTAGARRSMSIPHVDAHLPDELSLDVKEESATPHSLNDEETGDTTADESNSLPPPKLPMSRGKRPNPLAPTDSPVGLKRKRAESTLGTPITPQAPAEPPTHVLWTRNFGQISRPTIEFASTHRHGGMFANPIKERDAPGYSNIILRPQDIKSIKAAISAGNKAALEKEKSLGDAIAKDASVWLPISEDLIPPKGIVNYAQLEKELMRMFANAVMFNADPSRGFGDRFSKNRQKRGGDGYEFDEDGVVKGTKDMQIDVEKTIGDLRSAEPVSKGFVRGSSAIRGSSVVRGGSVRASARGSSVAATEDEIDELAGDADVGSVAKRRRKG